MRRASLWEQDCQHRWNQQRRDKHIHPMVPVALDLALSTYATLAYRHQAPEQRVFGGFEAALVARADTQDAVFQVLEIPHDACNGMCADALSPGRQLVAVESPGNEVFEGFIKRLAVHVVLSGSPQLFPCFGRRGFPQRF